MVGKFYFQEDYSLSTRLTLHTSHHEGKRTPAIPGCCVLCQTSPQPLTSDPEKYDAEGHGRHG